MSVQMIELEEVTINNVSDAQLAASFGSKSKPLDYIYTSDPGMAVSCK